MPAVFEEVLAKEINSGNFSPVYILFGEDSYLKKYYSDKICNNAYDGDPFFNLQKFDGDASLQDVYDAVVQFPMMSSKKCVLLSDYDFEHASKNDFDKLWGYHLEPLLREYLSGRPKNEIEQVMANLKDAYENPENYLPEQNNSDKDKDKNSNENNA